MISVLTKKRKKAKIVLHNGGPHHFLDYGMTLFELSWVRVAEPPLKRLSLPWWRYSGGVIFQLLLDLYRRLGV